MKFKLFSSRLRGKSLTLSAMQGGRTAGPVTQTNYGIVAASAGGVAITVDRTRIQCAPDSVRFGVDLSGADFDTPGPGPGEVYDPRLHELMFLWNTGDAGKWSAPRNVLPEWNDKSRAKGPWFAHCYTKPGSYTVTLTVIEPSSGKIATDSVKIEVTDPDTAYSGQKTVCINPPGVKATGWGPADALYFEWDPAHERINNQPWWKSINIPSDRRFLFNPAASYPGKIGFWFDGSVSIRNPYIGSAGSGRAILNSVGGFGSSARLIHVQPNFGGTGSSTIPDFRISRIDGRGTFDPTIEFADELSADGKAAGFLGQLKYSNTVISDCRVSGFQRTAVHLYMGSSNTNKYPAHAHLDDVVITDGGGTYFGVLTAPHDVLLDSSLTVSGCFFGQNPNAMDGGANTKAPLRENGHHKLNIRCSENYAKDDNNAAWKLCNQPTVDIGHLINVDGLTAEAGTVPLWIQQNYTANLKRSAAMNAIVDGAVLVADYSTNHLVVSNGPGLTLRNVLGIVPNSPRLHNDSIPDWSLNDEERGADWPSLNGLVGQIIPPGGQGRTGRDLFENQTEAGLIVPGTLNRESLLDAGFTYIGPQVVYGSRSIFTAVSINVRGTPSAETLAARCAIYNSTFVTDRPAVDNGGYTRVTLTVSPEFTNIINDNNILDGPWLENAGNEHPDGPLATDTLWAPRSLGFKGYQTKILRTEFATPPDAVRSAAPLPGSPALGAAVSGETAYFDITGKVRPVYPSIGAWEAR